MTDREPSRSGRRADARRNEQSVLDAAAREFVAAGVHAPVRDIAARAGVGVGTVYRHFPTRADLIVAVFRHQIDDCARAGPQLLAASASPLDALRSWLDAFVDFLVTKHGLAEALRPGSDAFGPLHDEFLRRLVPVCDDLLGAAAAAGQLRGEPIAGVDLMRAVGNLSAGGGDAGTGGFDVRRMARLLVDGLAAQTGRRDD